MLAAVNASEKNDVEGIKIIVHFLSILPILRRFTLRKLAFFVKGEHASYYIFKSAPETLTQPAKDILGMSRCICVRGIPR
jgi:hypothetical protein